MNFLFDKSNQSYIKLLLIYAKIFKYYHYTALKFFKGKKSQGNYMISFH